MTRDNSVFTDYKNSQKTFGAGLDAEDYLARIGPTSSTLATSLRHKTPSSRASKFRTQSGREKTTPQKVQPLQNITINAQTITPQIMMMRTGKDEKTLQDFKDQHRNKMRRRNQSTGGKYDTTTVPDLAVEGSKAAQDEPDSASAAPEKVSTKKRRIFHTRSRSAVADQTTQQTDQQRRENIRDKFLGI